MKKLLLIGGGGHCNSVLDCVSSTGLYDEIGIVDNKSSVLANGMLVGNDNDLPALLKKGWTDAFVTVGSIGNTAVRRKLYHTLKEIGFSIPVIIDPTAVIAAGVSIGEGTFIGKQAIINIGSEIGSCAILNSGSIIEHDCVVQDFAHVSPGAVLCGGVLVGADTHIGAGSVVCQSIQIGANSLIGAGSVVTKNIPSDVKAYGNPCRVVNE